ncbi:MAG: efflux RND transporter periplasmic adaptor subunit [Alphaproteobacteria bacterium]|nr:efflux RND transporter periplasmic adaptor subunit [Alphaproteobacteria bacterium]
MRKSVPIWLQLVLLALLLIAGAALWQVRAPVGEAIAQFMGSPVEKTGGKARKRGSRAVPVIVARVGQVRNDELITAVGTARARRSVMLHAKTDGVIVAFPQRAGARVKAGQTIFELDSKRAKLAVQIAEKRLEEARRLLERSELLKRNRVNSSANVTDAKVVAERAELELSQAKEVLQDLNIVAPFDGVLGLPKAEAGDRVTAATPIASFDMRAELFVEFEVPERFSARLSPGDKIEAVTPSHERTKFAGKVQYIDSRIDPVSRTMTVRAIIPNKDDVLRPGMSFVVELLLPGKTFASVPELSLQWRKGESYVWTVENGAARKVLVTTVKRLNAVVLVDGDVAPGDQVIVEGVQRLRPGRKVRFQPADAAKPKPAEDISAKPKASKEG